MLNPSRRVLYLNELKPPENYYLDRAIATTFSLDLVSLLMAPLSMTYFSVHSREDILKDPIALLEALKKTTDRFAVFCQRGRISLPKADSLLFRYLEPVVVEVWPPDRGGVFHPKIWILRFQSGDASLPVVYRVLCLSRNLTFDCSWDTLVCLEGELETKRKKGFSKNRPLHDFLRALPQMSAAPLSPAIGQHLNILSDEILRVRFKAPEGFEEDDILFLPAGIPGYTKMPGLIGHSRSLIISPFLTDSWIKKTAFYGKNNILISCLESLESLSLKTIDGIKNNTQIYIMNDAAQQTETIEEAESNISGIRTDEFSGLHAKLYLLEEGWDVRILTGSANATEAAFKGKNVEFLIGLKGRKSQFGIDRFLGNEADKTSFRSLLLPYVRTEEVAEADLIMKNLEDRLERARRSLAASDLVIEVIEKETDSFQMILSPGSKVDLEESNCTCYCYPASVNASLKKNIEPLLNDDNLVFDTMTLESLTGFWVFEIKLKHEGKTAEIAFVLNIPVHNLPEGRSKRILHRLIADREKFTRYLLLLLGDNNSETDWQTRFFSNRQDGHSNGFFSDVRMNLTEELLRAYSREPEKIDQISKLIEELKESENYKEIIPDGFEQVWQVFQTARKEEKGT